MAGSKAMRSHLGRALRPLCSPGVSATRSPAPAPARTAAAATGAAAPFSTTTAQRKRKTRDNNPNRGVSSLYRSGPREPLSMSDVPLPRPRDFKRSAAYDEAHGLWGFFPAPGRALPTPDEAQAHGRAWAVEELRRKSWEDLHALWWVCCRERNMLATSKADMERHKVGFGTREIEDRDDEVRKTMRAIKHALTERYYTWQDAVEVARQDPEIDWEGDGGQVFNPSAYEEEEVAAESWPEPGKEAGEAMPAEGQPSQSNKEATR